MMRRSERPPEDCVRGLMSRVTLLVEMEPRGKSLYDRRCALEGAWDLCPAPSFISLLLPGREVNGFALSHTCCGELPHYRPKVNRDNQ